MPVWWMPEKQMEYVGGTSKLPDTFRPSFFTDDMWAAANMLLSYIVSWVDRNKAVIRDLQKDVLKYLLHAFEPSETVEEVGKEVQMVGFPVKRLSKLEMMKTLALYGFFPFEMAEMGLHRGISYEEEGEKLGLVGSLIIMWDVSGSHLSYSIWEGELNYIPFEFRRSIAEKTEDNFSYKLLIEMATIYYFVDTAAKRGDYISLLLTPFGMVGNTTKVTPSASYRIYLPPENGALLKYNVFRSAIKSISHSTDPDAMKVKNVLEERSKKVLLFPHARGVMNIVEVIAAMNSSFNEFTDFYSRNPESLVDIYEFMDEIALKIEPLLSQIKDPSIKRVVEEIYNYIIDLKRNKVLLYKTKKTGQWLFLHQASYGSAYESHTHPVCRYWAKVLGRDRYSCDTAYCHDGGIAYPYWLASRDYEGIKSFLLNYDYVGGIMQKMAGVGANYYHSRGWNDDWLLSLAFIYDNAERLAIGGKRPTLMIFTDMVSDVFTESYVPVWDAIVKKMDIYIIDVVNRQPPPLKGMTFTVDRKFRRFYKKRKLPSGEEAQIPILEDVPQFISIYTNSKKPFGLKVRVKGTVKDTSGKEHNFDVLIGDKYFKETMEIPLIEIIAKKIGIGMRDIAPKGLVVMEFTTQYWGDPKDYPKEAGIYFGEAQGAKRLIMADLNKELKNGEIKIITVTYESMIESILSQVGEKKVFMEWGEMAALEGY